MRMFVTALVSIFVTLSATSAVAKAVSRDGQPRVSDWLSDAGVRSSATAYDVRAVQSGRVLSSHGADKALNPASVIKLLTSYAALDMLGADYRWKTRFYLDGSLDPSSGVLDGNLVLLGGGDPKLVVEDLSELVLRLRATGLRKILGDLIIDDSLYRVPPSRVFDGQESQPYNVVPNAALMNFKATKFTITALRGITTIELKPMLGGVRIHNAIRLTGKKGKKRRRCRYRASGLQITQLGTHDKPELKISGRYSTACGRQSAFHAVLSHSQFMDAFFRAGWQASGGQWSGRARLLSADESAAAAIKRVNVNKSKPWFTWVSPRTLADVIVDVNKFSNNVMIRQVLLHLAASSHPGPATIGKAKQVLSDWLTSKHIRLKHLVLDNGSGLSRHARMSAHGLVDLLLHAARSEHETALREALPVVGVDGTMARRLKKHPVAKQAWIKTGSLEGVRSIAGYVRARSGKMYAMAFVVNGKALRSVRKVQDRLIQWIYQHG